jgi:hypothetical protein
MQDDGQALAYDRMIAASAQVRFAKALNRSITGSMNDMINYAAYLLEEGFSPHDTGFKLNQMPMTAIAQGKETHGIPREVFTAMIFR